MSKGSDFYFKAYFSWGAAFDQIPDEDVGRFCKALWRYMREHKEPENLNGYPGVLWAMALQDIRKLEKDRENGQQGWAANPRNAANKREEDPEGLEGGNTGVDYSRSTEEKSIVKEEKRKDIKKNSSCKEEQAEPDPAGSTTTTDHIFHDENKSDWLWRFCDKSIEEAYPVLVKEFGEETVEEALRQAWERGKQTRNLRYIRAACRGKKEDREQETYDRIPNWDNFR